MEEHRTDSRAELGLQLVWEVKVKPSTSSLRDGGPQELKGLTADTELECICSHHYQSSVKLH